MRPAPLRPAATVSTAAAQPQRYLTNDEAAEYLRLSPRTLEKQRVIGGGEGRGLLLLGLALTRLATSLRDAGRTLVVGEVVSRAGVPTDAIDEVILGAANQAGEDNRNVARMSALLAGLPTSVPGTTLNRLCGSGMDAVIAAARAIRAGEGELYVAGGVESMSRAPFVMPKADAAFSRSNAVHDTTIGWRFVNPVMKAQYGIDSMPETAENVAEEFGISRADQDAFALRSQERAARAIKSGRFAKEITPVTIPQRKGDPVVVDTDEHPRTTTLEKLGALKAPFREGGSVTAGMAIYDTMQFVPNDIVTVGIGMAASMGQLLLTAGTKGKRYITPNARVLLHQPHGGFGGTSSDIQTQAQLILDMKRRLAEITAAQTGKSVEQVNADGDRDRWFTADEALAYGFVDHIRESATDVIGGGGTEN